MESILAISLATAAAIGGMIMGRTVWFDKLMRNIGEWLNGKIN